MWSMSRAWRAGTAGSENFNTSKGEGDMTNDSSANDSSDIRALIAEAEDQRTGLHAQIDDLTRQMIEYLIDGSIDGNGVFDGSKIAQLRAQAFGLHDLIDGNPVGTLSQQCAAETARVYREAEQNYRAG
jgi:hypothetical protein